VSESMNIIALVPSGAIGYLFRSYVPLWALQVETSGLILDLRSRLMES
jgi:hypothetical protein